MQIWSLETEEDWVHWLRSVGFATEPPETAAHTE
jgi:hypothetical protein